MPEEPRVGETEGSVRRGKPRTVVPELSQLDNPALYMRVYRERQSPEVAKRRREKELARQAAALHVAKAHPDEFAAAIAAEEAKRGV